MVRCHTPRSARARATRVFGARSASWPSCVSLGSPVLTSHCVLVHSFADLAGAGLRALVFEGRLTRGLAAWLMSGA
eukprot:11437845-Alexandrium_andersonii.AAC.1